jgi:ferredoxin-NADP reductase
MMEFSSKLLAVKQKTHDVKTFRFSVPDNFSFAAGQFVMLFVDVEGNQDVRPFSISSSPAHGGWIEITKKIGDSRYSQNLNSLKEGDAVKIKGPSGRFILEEKEKIVVMLAGGIGVTPFRSMLYYATDKNLPTRFVLFYSNKTPDDIAFREEFEDLADKNKNIRIVYTVTRPEESNQKWTGPTGRIDEKMIRNNTDIHTLNTALFYVAGPPSMVDAMVSTLKGMGVPHERIRVERFFGY